MLQFLSSIKTDDPFLRYLPMKCPLHTSSVRSGIVVAKGLPTIRPSSVRSGITSRARVATGTTYHFYAAPTELGTFWVIRCYKDGAPDGAFGLRSVRGSSHSVTAANNARATQVNAQTPMNCRARFLIGAINSARSWSAAALCRFGKRLPFTVRFKFFGDLYLIDFEAINGFHHCRRGRTLKPCCRTPRILTCHGNQAMAHRVLMNVVQSRKVRLFVSEPRVSEVVPDLAMRCLVKPVDPRCCLRMKKSQHVR